MKKVARNLPLFLTYLPYGIIGLFFIAYLALSVIKHTHYLSGYDLAIMDQAIWKYSHFINPVITVHSYPDLTIYTDHMELIFMLIAPLYWIWNSVIVLLVLQVLGICTSAVAIYKICELKKLNSVVSTAIIISYLAFYGIQNAIWADVHSLVFAIPFLALFIYSIEKKNIKLSLLFLFLALICKEDIGMFTFLISGIYYVKTKNKILLLYAGISVLYVCIILFGYFPHFTSGYKYQNSQGLLSNLDIQNMYNSHEKREVWVYSLLSFGLVPLLSPLFMLLPVADLAHYFVLGSDRVTSAQGLFMHYRAPLSLFLIMPTIYAVVKFKKLNTPYFALYLLICTALCQYILHLPASYLVKSWFWTTPNGASSIDRMISTLTPDMTLASQVNITPHITHRKEVYTIWPETHAFKDKSICNKDVCQWAHWGGNPQYLLVDTSPEWDARHLLTNNAEFKEVIANLEHAEVLQLKKRIGSTSLYTILKQPSEVQ